MERATAARARNSAARRAAAFAATLPGNLRTVCEPILTAAVATVMKILMTGFSRNLGAVSTIVEALWR
jgi:hypothetical protein